MIATKARRNTNVFAAEKGVKGGGAEIIFLRGGLPRVRIVLVRIVLVRIVLVRVPTNQVKSIKNPVQINEQNLYLFAGFVSPRRFRHEGTKKHEVGMFHV